MKLKDIKTSIRYIVTESEHDPVLKGDRVFRDVDNKLVIDRANIPVLIVKNWQDLDVAVVFDQDFYQRRADYHESQMEDFKKIIEENQEER